MNLAEMTWPGCLLVCVLLVVLLLERVCGGGE